ncbi:hypothetical protein [Photobacterium sp. 1_MG-2023]|uniref:hypothetical protein n=1 Tax=Photobacterium sp. 1_MG-2023 TaxID=3062646 RepID=UPI0026E2E964|nr:hypothetical protein [Photobacterium sp. 1_MG-2023]MDO6707283.1 hypothetical protein [Photobacterium sp. 1_MG-2023]
MSTTISLPEYTEADQAQRRQQVLDAEVIYEWECVLRSKDKHLMPFIMAGIFSLIYGISYYLSSDVILFYMWAISVVIFSPVSYFLFDVDYDYKGQITPKGVIIQKTERVPEIFYKITRVMAYFGIVVCLIAGLMMGPLAFVGAGAFALLSFKMTGFHKKTEIEVIPFLREKTYQYMGCESLYQHTVSTHGYGVSDFWRTSAFGAYEVAFSCMEEQFFELDKMIRQYVDVTDD